MERLQLAEQKAPGPRSASPSSAAASSAAPPVSPATQRATELAAQLVVPAPGDGSFQHREAEEIFGMKSRWVQPFQLFFFNTQKIILNEKYLEKKHLNICLI